VAGAVVGGCVGATVVGTVVVGAAVVGALVGGAVVVSTSSLSPPPDMHPERLITEKSIIINIK